MFYKKNFFCYYKIVYEERGMKSFLNDFEGFITGNGIWILVGCLAFALIVSVIFLYLNIQKEKREEDINKKALIARIAEQYAKKEAEKNAEKQVETAVEVKPVKKAPVRKPKAEKVEEKPKTVPAKKAPAKKASTVAVKAEVEDEGSGDYDISYDAEAKEWVVKRTNLTRATKRTATKQQAIDYAKPLAEKHGVKLIVHTKNN